jgi:hypothetical protein
MTAPKKPKRQRPPRISPLPAKPTGKQLMDYLGLRSPQKPAQDEETA